MRGAITSNSTTTAGSFFGGEKSETDFDALDKDGNKGTLTLGAITINTPGKLTLEADQLVLATQTTKEDQSHTSAGRDLAWQKIRAPMTAFEAWPSSPRMGWPKRQGA